MTTTSYTSGGRTATITEEIIGRHMWYVVVFSDFPWMRENFERLEAAEQCVNDRFNPKPQRRRRVHAQM
jgi:hypothetical protein